MASGGLIIEDCALRSVLFKLTDMKHRATSATAELLVMQTGKSGAWAKGMKQSILGVRRLKVKVTRRRK